MVWMRKCDAIINRNAHENDNENENEITFQLAHAMHFCSFHLWLDNIK